ncbi:MAG: extensin family protein [Pseudomonadota bacterium]
MKLWAALRLFSLVALAPLLAHAEAPSTSLRPEARPEAPPEALIGTGAPSLGAVILSEGQGVTRSLRPQARRVSVAGFRSGGEAAGRAVDPASVLQSSLRPAPRPRSVERAARRLVLARAKGQICGDPSLQGERIAPIPGRLPGCGVAEPIRLRSVSGVALTTASTMDCPTAKALKTWVERGVKPAVGTRGGGVSNLRVVAHYACRTRNHRPGAKISEHGKGRAIDIAGIGLNDGSEITLLTGWNRGADGRALRAMWSAACGPFGTVLGPEADAAHRDHFHFDTARYRAGAYCR